MIDDSEILSGTILMTNFIKIRQLIRELLGKQVQRKDDVSACFRMTEEGRIKPDLLQIRVQGWLCSTHDLRTSG
jgi:hypothetical protein